MYIHFDLVQIYVSLTWSKFITKEQTLYLNATYSSYESCHTFTTAYQTWSKWKEKVYDTSSPSLLLQYPNIIFTKKEFDKWTEEQQLEQLNLKDD